MLVDHPGGSNIFFGFGVIALREMDPAESVPIRRNRRHGRQISDIQLLNARIPQCRRDRCYCGFGILLRPFQMRLLKGELISDVVPDFGGCGQFDGLIKRR